MPQVYEAFNTLSKILPELEIGNTDLICEMLAQETDFISFLPDYATKKEIQKQRLSYLDVHDFDIEIWAQLLYHRNKWLSPQMQAFLSIATV